MNFRPRWNVLILMTTGYLATLLIFIFYLTHTGEPKSAYDLINEPLMALIGGSLAISKDLIGADDHDQDKNSGESPAISGDLNGADDRDQNKNSNAQ